MLSPSCTLRQIPLLLLLVFGAWSAATAQGVGHKTLLLDSSKVYTYVARMPKYPRQGGMAALTSDLLREFATASAAAGCTVPTFPVYVTLTVGPSGTIYDVKSLNNLPLISKEEAAASKKGIVASKRPLPELPAACETALATAARQLPRFTPGIQSGRKVAVNFMVKLIGPAK